MPDRPALRNIALPSGLQAQQVLNCTPLKLEVSRHPRLEVASASREITPVPRTNPRRWRDRPRPRGAAVNCAQRGARDESGVLRNRAESRPSAARP